MSKIELYNNEIEIKTSTGKGVVSFELSAASDSVLVLEECDYYYGSYLSKSELEVLINHLTELKNKMK